MRSLVLFSLLAIFSCPAFSQNYLKDVPSGHYAYNAVYDLIRMGVTNGFPDGTFRGNNLMSRYEAASFIQKFSGYFRQRRGTEEKLIEELRSEIAIQKYPKEVSFSGEVMARARYGKTDLRSGLFADYRLKLKYSNDLGRGASLKINLDTMDAGFGGASRNLVTEMLNMEGKISIGALVVRATSGPGDVNHPASAYFPIDNNLCYREPRRTISVSSSFEQNILSLEFLARSTAESGLIGVSEISGKYSRGDLPFKITINPRYFSASGGIRDSRIDLLGEASVPGRFSTKVLFGIAKTDSCPHGLYAGIDLKIGDGVRMLAQKIGAQYREKISYGIYDIFDRKLNDGTENFGAVLKTRFREKWTLALKGDYANPGQVSTGELRLGYNLFDQAFVDIYCQNYFAGTSSRVYAVEFNSPF